MYITIALILYGISIIINNISLISFRKRIERTIDILKTYTKELDERIHNLEITSTADHEWVDRLSKGLRELDRETQVRLTKSNKIVKSNEDQMKVLENIVHEMKRNLREQDVSIMKNRNDFNNIAKECKLLQVRLQKDSKDYKDLLMNIEKFRVESRDLHKVYSETLDVQMHITALYDKLDKLESNI